MSTTEAPTLQPAEPTTRAEWQVHWLTSRSNSAPTREGVHERRNEGALTALSISREQRKENGRIGIPATQLQGDYTGRCCVTQRRYTGQLPVPKALPEAYSKDQFVAIAVDLCSCTTVTIDLAKGHLSIEPPSQLCVSSRTTDAPCIAF